MKKSFPVVPELGEMRSREEASERLTDQEAQTNTADALMAGTQDRSDLWRRWLEVTP